MVVRTSTYSAGAGDPYLEYLLRRVDPELHFFAHTLYTHDWFWVVEEDRSCSRNAEVQRKNWLKQEYYGESYQFRAMNVLEVLLALIRRGHLSKYYADDLYTTMYIFRLIANNICDVRNVAELCMFMDQCQTVHRILDSILAREIEYDGSGGFFPLEKPRRDQRTEGLIGQYQSWLKEVADDGILRLPGYLT